MKRLILTFTAVLMIVVAFGNTDVKKEKKQEKYSILTIKGKVRSMDNYTYELFVFRNGSYKSLMMDGDYKGKYKVSVDTKHNYKLVFTSSDEVVKTMYIQSAEPTGKNYGYSLDFDFRFDKYFAELKKKGNKYKHYVYHKNKTKRITLD
tara:strand:- start:97 stop:543 length:447 start_codon:yes stop_codon:yes gene_type:complete